MKKLSILFFYSLLYFQLTAQLKEVFYDDFSSNKNQWSQGKIEGLYAEVKDGKYIIDCGVKNLLNPQIVFGIDSTQDYTISVTLTQSKTLSPTSGGGVIFGSNLTDYFCCYITSEGNCGFAEVKNNQIVSDNPGIGTNKEAIKTGEGAKNTLRIRKWEFVFEFYVNDRLVALSTSNKLHGLYIGMAALSGGSYEFDDLKISGTPIVTTGSFCQLFPLIYESSKNKFSYIMGMKTEKNQFASLNYQSHENIMTIVIERNTSLLDYSIKKFPTREEGIKGLKEFITEQGKCLPDFQFTEDNSTSGQLKYKIIEKTPKDKSIIISQISLTQGTGPVNILLTIVSINKR